jgi:hypothetical protein
MTLCEPGSVVIVGAVVGSFGAVPGSPEEPPQAASNNAVRVSKFRIRIDQGSLP